MTAVPCDKKFLVLEETVYLKGERRQWGRQYVGVLIDRRRPEVFFEWSRHESRAHFNSSLVEEGHLYTALDREAVYEFASKLWRVIAKDKACGGFRESVFGNHWGGEICIVRRQDGDVFLCFNKDPREADPAFAVLGLFGADELERLAVALEEAGAIVDRMWARANVPGRRPWHRPWALLKAEARLRVLRFRRPRRRRA